MNAKKNTVVIEIETLDPAETIQRLQMGLMDLVKGTLMNGSESEDLVIDRQVSSGMIEALSIVQATLGTEARLEPAVRDCQQGSLIFDILRNPLEGNEEAGWWPVLPN